MVLAGGDEESRTLDPLLARQVLSQLSYTPTFGSWLFVHGSWYLSEVLHSSSLINQLQTINHQHFQYT